MTIAWRVRIIDVLLNQKANLVLHHRCRVPWWAQSCVRLYWGVFEDLLLDLAQDISGKNNRAIRAKHLQPQLYCRPKARHMVDKLVFCSFTPVLEYILGAKGYSRKVCFKATNLGFEWMSFFIDMSCQSRPGISQSSPNGHAATPATPLSPSWMPSLPPSARPDFRFVTSLTLPFSIAIAIFQCQCHGNLAISGHLQYSVCIRNLSKFDCV